MIERNDDNNIIRITILLTIDYYNHSYYINNVSSKDLLNGKIRCTLLNI